MKKKETRKQTPAAGDCAGDAHTALNPTWRRGHFYQGGMTF